MIDQKSSIFIPGKFLWMLLGIMFMAAGAGVWMIFSLHASDPAAKQADLLLPITTIVQSVLTGITVLFVLYLFQSSKQHRYLERATSHFLGRILPAQMEKHFLRIQECPEPREFTPCERPRFEEILNRYFPPKAKLVGRNQAFVNHVTGSLAAHYLFVSSLGVKLPVFVQLNVRSLFFTLRAERSDFGEHARDERRIDYVCDADSENFDPDTKAQLAGGTPAQVFFAESAKIGWRTIKWQFSLHETGDAVFFSGFAKMTEDFLHDPSEQLFIANDISSCVRGVADGINGLREDRNKVRIEPTLARWADDGAEMPAVIQAVDKS